MRYFNIELDIYLFTFFNFSFGCNQHWTFKIWNHTNLYLVSDPLKEQHNTQSRNAYCTIRVIINRWINRSINKQINRLNRLLKKKKNLHRRNTRRDPRKANRFWAPIPAPHSEAASPKTQTHLTTKGYERTTQRYRQDSIVKHARTAVRFTPQCYLWLELYPTCRRGWQSFLEIRMEAQRQ